MALQRNASHLTLVHMSTTRYLARRHSDQDRSACSGSSCNRNSPFEGVQDHGEGGRQTSAYQAMRDQGWSAVCQRAGGAVTAYLPSRRSAPPRPSPIGEAQAVSVGSELEACIQALNAVGSGEACVAVVPLPGASANRQPGCTGCLECRADHARRPQAGRAGEVRRGRTCPELGNSSAGSSAGPRTRTRPIYRVQDPGSTADAMVSAHCVDPREQRFSAGCVVVPKMFDAAAAEPWPGRACGCCSP